MEVKGIKYMFEKFVQQFKIMYEYYIGDGDTKTFKKLVDSKPYGYALQVKKKNVPYM